MRVRLLLLLLFPLAILKAQIFPGVGGVIKNDSTVSAFNIVVSGVPVMTKIMGLVRVKMEIVHPAVQELHIYLKSPGGACIALSVSNGKGANYIQTTFENNASISIRDASPPFTGTFKPENSLAVFNINNSPGSGTWSLIILDDQKNSNSGLVQSLSLEFGSNPAQPTPFTQSNLPVFVVNTGGKSIPTINDIRCNMYILDASSGINNLSDTQLTKVLPIGIHIRGNSSVGGPKDPYSFSPLDIFGEDSNMSVLGMPPENDWILNNSYMESSFMKDRLAYYLSNRMGRYASRTRFCELVIDGDYRGLYILMEKIKQDKNRVDISSLKITDTSGTDVTGGYILKKDGAPGLKDSGFMNTASGFYYLYQDPDSPVIQQKKYIKAFIDTAVTTLLTVPLYDTINGYRKYVDYKSAIDYIIICELGVSGDTYNRSTYWYKHKINKGNKLFFGPVWDFNYGWTSPTTAFRFPTFTPWKKMYEDSTFKKELWCRYNSVRGTFLNSKTINKVIDSMIAPIYDAAYRNDERWPQVKTGTQIFSNLYYKDACFYLKKYTGERLQCMDTFMRGSCNGVKNTCAPIFEYEITNACTGDTAYININTTAGNFTISPTLGVRKVNKNLFLVGPPATGTYTLKWTSCNTADSTNITISNSTKPTVTCIGADSVILGDSILLVAHGATNYVWFPNVNRLNTTGDSVYVKPTISTTYTVNGYLGLGCSNVAVKKITVLPAHPLYMYTSADSLCSGKMLKLTAKGAEEYIWDVNNLLTIADSLILYPTTDLVVKLSGLVGGNLSDFKMKNIKVFPVKQLSVSPSSPVYNGTAPVMLVVKGGISYTWTPMQGLNVYDNDTVFASPASNITYTVTAIDSNQCATNTTINVANKVGIASGKMDSQLNVSPNPMNDNFTMDYIGEKSLPFSIYNCIGEQILQGEVNKGKSIINSKDWASGLYFLRFENSVLKIIKE